MKKILILSISLFLLSSSLFANSNEEKNEEVKIGFIVKMPEEPWFQNEWKFAHEAGDEYGFKVVEIGATDGEKVLAAIDNLYVQGAQGFVICTPDVKLGPAIIEKADSKGLKVMTVDDRLVDANGVPLVLVPHMGISAFNIGKEVGKSMIEEMNARGWKQEETGFIRISFDELPTAVDRTTGMTESLIAGGFDADYIFDSPQKTTDTEGGFNAANITITKNPNIKHWIIGGLNDEAALGGTRATEGHGFSKEDVIAIGIGGTGTAVAEFEKADETGFFATALISPKRHGYETTELMYRWITEGQEPPSTTWTTAVMIDRNNYKEQLKLNGLD